MSKSRKGKQLPIQKFLNWSMILPMLLLIFSVLGFYREAYLEPQIEENRTPVAKILTLDGSSRRKSNHRLIWFDSQAGDSLYIRDSIQTAQNSRATILFDDGTRIKMGEKSLIVIEKRDRQPLLNLVSGSLSSVGLNRNLSFKVGSRKLEAGSASFELSQTRNGAQVSVKKGSVSVLDGTQKISVNRDEEISFQGNKNKIRQFPIILEQPELGAIKLIDPEEKIQFVWKDKRKVKGKRLKIAFSTNRNFKNVINTVQIERFVEQKNLRLKEGHYFWRIQSNGLPLSSSRYFEVSRTPKIVLLAPKNKPYPRDRKLAFKWATPKFVDHAEIQISKDPSFKNLIIHEQDLKSERYLAQLPEEGIYYWRIKGKSSDPLLNRNSFVSDSGTFKIGKPLSQLPPEIIFPGDDEVIQSLQKKTSIYFKWSDENMGHKYRIEIANDIDFSETILNQTVPSTHFQWENTQLGQYFWRVSRLHGNQVYPSQNSPKFRISSKSPLQLLAPEKSGVFRYLKVKPTIYLEWRKEDKASRYVVQVSNSINFNKKETQRFLSDSNRIEFKTPKRGEFFWRVFALDHSNGVLRKSKSRKFSVKLKKRLAPPSQIYKPIQVRVPASKPTE